MKTTSFLLIYLACLSFVAAAQNSSSSGAPASPQQSSNQPVADQGGTPSNFTSAKGFVLEDGSPVKLRLNRTISSGDAHTGDTIDFEVVEDITLNGTLIIPKGGLAFATVTEAQAKRRMARGGKLDINIDYVKLLSSERATLRAVKEVKGGGHTGAMTGGIVATSIVFFPAAPFFLFMHGKDISIPKGTEITAYVSGDMKLDPTKFQPMGSSGQTGATQGPGTTMSVKVQLESNPSGADIEIDGSFVGNTPSDIQVAEGDHIISVKKSGFTTWERKMKINSGSSIHLNAELEKSPSS